MMKFLLVLSVTIATSFGSTWNDLRGGDVSLPTTKTEAEKSSWVVVDEDQEYKITWYGLDSDKSLNVAYDNKGHLAGVKTTWLEKDIDADFLKILTSEKSKNFFEACEVNGEKAFKSVVTFTHERVLKSGGRDKLGGDELAASVYVKQGKSFKRLSREGCVQAKGTFHEQSCTSGYGLVLANFKSDTDCEFILPFYAIYDPEGEGDLLGFGWILATESSKKGLFLKSLSADSCKALLPEGPSCLTSHANLAAVEVWLSYAESLDTSCPEGSWVEKHCQHKFSLRDWFKWKKNSGESSDSSDSDDSDSSGDSENKKPFWKKLFG